MRRGTWIAGLALCALLPVWHSAAAQTPGPPVVRVLVMNGAEVPADTLDRAQDDATRVFHLSGIALVWVDVELYQAGCLTVRIVTDPISTKSGDPYMLGVAPSTPEARGRNVWIFYPRIKVYSAELGIHAAQLLGHVVAHEMGHLLLPYGAHALAGIMRPGWDRAQVKSAAEGLLTFTPDQAASIKERLQASVWPISRAR